MFSVLNSVRGALVSLGGLKTEPPRLSPQQLLDCVGPDNSCLGGYPQDALEYLALPSNPGLVLQAQYNYTAEKGTCQVPAQGTASRARRLLSLISETYGVKIAAFEQTPYGGGPLGLMLAAQYQPVVVILHAAESFKTFGGVSIPAVYLGLMLAVQYQPVVVIRHAAESFKTFGGGQNSLPYTSGCIPADVHQWMYTRAAPLLVYSGCWCTAAAAPLPLWMYTSGCKPVGVHQSGCCVVLCWLGLQGYIYNDPDCYDPNTPPILDHAVLVVGYAFAGVGSPNSYWIILNSWGTGWGDNGYMRMAMTTTPGGICGITKWPGLYPVLDCTYSFSLLVHLLLYTCCCALVVMHLLLCTCCYALVVIHLLLYTCCCTLVVALIVAMAEAIVVVRFFVFVLFAMAVLFAVNVVLVDAPGFIALVGCDRLELSSCVLLRSRSVRQQ